MRPLFVIVVLAASLPACLRGAERINHAGRILGPMPVVPNATLFNTPQAEAIVSALLIRF